MHSVTGTIFPVFAFKVTHRVIFLTRFCKLLTRVAILSGGGHVPQVPQWHDASGRRVRKKNKKERPYILRISPGAPLRPIGTNFWIRLRLVDVINFTKLYRKRLKGLDSMSGQSLTIPIGLRCRRLHCVNHCSHCDS